MKKTLITLIVLLMLMPKSYAATADADISLNIVNESANNVTISIVINNPSGQTISSVQSWLKFDKNILKGVSIDTTGSPFDFVAPGENTFNEADGIVKIGRASISGGSSQSEVFVAHVNFERLKPDQTEISFYNYQVDNSGNTSVRVFEDGFPVNILKAVPNSLKINGEKNVPQIKKEPPVKIKPEVKKDLYETVRPKNLKITSGPEYAILSWDKIDEMKGYNIYYSNRSGRYLLRRSAGNTNEYYLDGLKTGKTYYFAIKSYDNQNRETDYSNEVRIKAGFPASSTSPLIFTKSKQIIAKVKQHTNTGPAELIMIIVFLAGFTAFFVSKKQGKVL